MRRPDHARRRAPRTAPPVVAGGRRPLPASLAAALLGATAALLAAGGCAAPPPPISSHDLERPTDISFVCLRGVAPAADAGADDAANGGADGGADNSDGGDGGGATTAAGPRVSGRPMSECHPPLQFDPQPVDVTRRTFGFVTNTARGELAVIDMDSSKLVDLDPGIPENNLVPLGVLPEQMSASDDGCRLVTANRGSCDLTMVDPAAVLTPTLATEVNVKLPAPPASAATDTVVVHGSSGTPLHLAPQEILFLPQNTAGMTGDQNLCPVGFDGADRSWKALVTFPSCDLVALVDLPSGAIEDSMFVRPDTQGVKLESGGSNPVCPYTDCGPGPRPPADDPTAAAQDPFVNPNGVRPGPLAILPDGSRAYVGLGSAAYVAAVGIAIDAGGQGHLADEGHIVLHDNDDGGGALGADRLRLSVDPYQKTGVAGQFGRFVGEGADRTRQYLYVFAHDGTVRVIDVSPAARQQPEVECDTNIDPIKLSADQRAAATCMPVTSPPTQRRPSSTGPGIRLPSLPVDVTFADLSAHDAYSDREQVLDGSFGFILTSSGATYIVNIDPTLRTQTLVNAVPTAATPVEVPPLVNSLRDHNQITFTPALDPITGPPRVDIPPVPPATGPQIEGIPVKSANDNATIIAGTTPVPVTTYIFFPERLDVVPQDWSLLWEGDLFGPSFSGQVMPEAADTGLSAFKDLGVDFCQAGALEDDIVNLVGCTVDSQCGPLQVCRLSDTVPQLALSLPVNGICVPVDATTQTTVLKNPLCMGLQDTVKRYEIVTATPSGLTIRPKIDEIPTTLLTPCTPRTGTVDPDSDCHPIDDPSRGLFKCLNQRCVQPCDSSAMENTCRLGRICVSYASSGPVGGGDFCADGPNLTGELITACGLSQLIGYKIQAGTSFVVQGSAPAPAIQRGVDPTGTTCSTVGVNPLLVNRIPLTAAALPRCTNVDSDVAHPNGQLAVREETDPPGSPPDTDSQNEQTAFLTIAHTTPQPNPCLFQGGPTATDPPDQPQPHLRVLFQNTQIRFILSNVEQYSNDIAPIVFSVHGGFTPDTVFMPGDVDIDMARRIVVSPLDSQAQLFDMSMTHEIPYLFVVDQRRLGLASAGVGATRGQVLRIHPRLANSDMSAFFPVYQDPSTTNGLWPIQ